MPSDVPKDGRCGSKVTTKIGLEVHDEVLDESFSDEDGMLAVVLYDGEHEQEVDAEYADVLPMLRRGWNTEAVIVERETEDSIDHERITIEDDDPYVTNRTTRLDGYCLRYPMDHGRCYVHQGSAREGDVRAMKHGLYTDRSRFVQWLEDEGRDEDRQMIEMMVDSWIGDADFDRDNVGKVNELYRLAIDQVRLFYAQDEFVEKADGDHNKSGEYSGLAYKQVIGTNDEGEPIEVFDENALNLPYSRLHSDVQQSLTKMGIYDSPEDKQAEATQSIAQALSGDE